MLKFSNFDLRNFFWGGAPKILKPVLGTPFLGLLLGKVWTTPANLGSQCWGFWSPQILMGLPLPKFWTNFLKLHLYPTFSAIKVAYRSSDLKDLAAKKRKKERKKLLL